VRAVLSMGDQVEAARQNSIKLKKKIQDRTGMATLELISPLKAQPWRSLIANTGLIKFSLIAECRFRYP